MFKSKNRLSTIHRVETCSKKFYYNQYCVKDPLDRLIDFKKSTLTTLKIDLINLKIDFINLKIDFIDRK